MKPPHRRLILSTLCYHPRWCSYGVRVRGSCFPCDSQQMFWLALIYIHAQGTADRTLHDMFELVSKLKAQSSNGSFHWNVAKETFELWALSFRKCHPEWDWLCIHALYVYTEFVLPRVSVLLCVALLYVVCAHDVCAHVACVYVWCVVCVCVFHLSCVFCHIWLVCCINVYVYIYV